MVAAAAVLRLSSPALERIASPFQFGLGCAEAHGGDGPTPGSVLILVSAGAGADMNQGHGAVRRAEFNGAPRDGVSGR
jgi:hypothetical protein